MAARGRHVYVAGMIGSMLVAGAMMLASFRWPDPAQWGLLLFFFKQKTAYEITV